MPYAVELYFDPAVEVAIRQIWQAIAEAGFKSPMLEAGYRPHVSLIVYDGDSFDVDSLQQNLASYVKTINPFPVELSSLGIFPTSEGVMFLGVTVTPELLRIHASFHHAFAAYSESLRSYYNIGQWVPHCTLGFGLSAEESAEILPICWRTQLPLRGQIGEIGIVKVSPVSCRMVFSAKLGSSEEK